MKYLILQNPGHNRVFYLSAEKMALAELKLALKRISKNDSKPEITFVKGIRYLSFASDKALNEEQLAIISRLAFVFALFQLEINNNQEYLLPVQLPEYQYLESKISSLLKYQGKTNELFTKMMVNVALLSSNFDYSENISLLDPVAGKGTTLFEGTTYGFNVFGIELDPKSVHDTSVFFKKYLETERIKHSSEKRRIAGASKNDAIFMDTLTYANSKEAFKKTESQRKFGLINGDTVSAYSYFKKEMFHLIVGDLPYGIHHGNTADKSSGTRNPANLLEDAVSGWKKVLYKGGTVVVAWNSFLISREKLGEIFTREGFQVFTEEPYGTFEHMVDKSIKRDVLVALKV